MKRYKCLNHYCDKGTMYNKVYDDDYTWGSRVYNVGQLAKIYPKEWELVEDDFVLPEKWCIKGCYEMECWQKDDMHNRTNSLFSYYSHWYQTTGVQLLYWEISDNKPDGYTEITFEQFKKHILKQDIMGKEIIGYKLKEDCKQYELAAAKIVDCKGAKLYGLVNASSDIEKLKESGVLDLWFEPVYEEEKKLPKINGYDGNYDAQNNVVKYGCAEFKELYLRELYKCQEIGSNRVIIDIKLDSGAHIKFSQIKEILDYIDSKK
jgi:hypothetical protein